jgi:cephalosporin-C deacetylase-like acetyl esterase
LNNKLQAFLYKHSSVRAAVFLAVALLAFAASGASAATTPQQNDSVLDVMTKAEHDANPVFTATVNHVAAMMNKHESPKSKQDLERLQANLRPRLLASLGLNPFPPAAPLNARVTGRTDKGDYVIENVVFESFPGTYVSANLYLPKDAKGKLPAVLNPIGHWYQYAKNETAEQDREISLAKLGYVVFTYDPVGQGERLKPGNEHNWGFNLLLVGKCIEGVMVYESMRALDYLLTRPEVDPARIAITGSSGGGENSFYSAAADPRIAASVPVVFFNEYTIWVREGGAHCICNHLPGIFTYADEFTIASLIAPRPLMPISGSFDAIFPLKGATASAKIMADVYKSIGAPDRFRFFTASRPHGYFIEEREAMYAWLNHWLLDKPAAKSFPEPKHETAPPGDSSILAFKDDSFFKKTQTLRTLGAQWAAALPEKSFPADTPATWAQTKSELLKSIIVVFGGLPEKSDLKAESRGTIEKDGFSVEKILFYSEPDIPVPALLAKPKTAAAEARVAIFVSRAGKQAALNSPITRGLLANGAAVFIPEVRGYGETYGGSGFEHMLVTDSIMIGEPVFGRRVWDIIRSLDYLESRNAIGPKTNAGCYGKGEDGLLCLYAAALDPRITAVAADRIQLSYKITFEIDYSPSDAAPDGGKMTDVTGEMPTSIFMAGALKQFDIPQIVAAVAPRRVLVTDPSLGTKNAKYKSFPEQIYNLLGAKDAFKYAPSASKKNALIVDWLVK